MKRTGPFKVSDIPVFNNKVYHLDLHPEELAKSILIVGDPERVPFIADEFLDHREIDRPHRGLRTITGTCRETGQRVSITSSGMGTPSLEIVLGYRAGVICAVIDNRQEDRFAEQYAQYVKDAVRVALNTLSAIMP